MFRALCASAAAAAAAAGAAPPPLPRLDIVGRASASGISSGADVAPMLHVAYSDRFFASGAFAGQAYGCAVTAFDADPRVSCASQPPTQRGPGCVGLASTGAAPCVGCGGPAGTTVGYDHCKKSPAVIQTARLQRWAEAAAADGDIAPLANLRDARVYTFRGTRDDVYLPGCVNATGEFFAPFVASRGQIVFEAAIPSQHSQPTVDPHVPRDSCGNYTVGGCQNCGYDGVGAMLQHFYDGALVAPPAGASADPARLRNFSQDLYGNASAQFGGLATTGFAYIPARCEAAPCRAHVALHGCGQSYVDPEQGLLYPLFGGYAPWADANGFVVLFVQGGGFAERGWVTNASQVMAACHDGYGQTGADFAFRKGAVLAAIDAMLGALGGEQWWLRPDAPAHGAAAAAEAAAE